MDDIPLPVPPLSARGLAQALVRAGGVLDGLRGRLGVRLHHSQPVRGQCPAVRGFRRRADAAVAGAGARRHAGQPARRAAAHPAEPAQPGEADLQDRPGAEHRRPGRPREAGRQPGHLHPGHAADPQPVHHLLPQLARPSWPTTWCRASCRSSSRARSAPAAPTWRTRGCSCSSRSRCTSGSCARPKPGAPSSTSSTSTCCRRMPAVSRLDAARTQVKALEGQLKDVLTKRDMMRREMSTMPPTLAVDSGTRSVIIPGGAAAAAQPAACRRRGPAGRAAGCATPTSTPRWSPPATGSPPSRPPRPAAAAPSPAAAAAQELAAMEKQPRPHHAQPGLRADAHAAVRARRRRSPRCSARSTRAPRNATGWTKSPAACPGCRPSTPTSTATTTCCTRTTPSC